MYVRTRDENATMAKTQREARKATSLTANDEEDKLETNNVLYSQKDNVYDIYNVGKFKHIKTQMSHNFFR